MEITGKKKGRETKKKNKKKKDEHNETLLCKIKIILLR